MNLIKLEIDGKRVIADSRQTILEVARENGIHSIPTLCHDDQLEPFASCYVCVVKVRGARTLVPACSTKVTAGMMVETNTAEIRRSRKAALELMLSNHYADCIGPCQLACPAGVDIQGYIALAALGKYRDAIQLIKQTNPLPAVCGRVCTRPCEVRGCRRSILDESVGIDFIKRYLADQDLADKEPFRPAVAPSNGKRVAVVGAGPAGLSCAYYLAVRGYAVEMFESLPEAGGMLRYGIPEYRLPKNALDLEIAQILDLGVKLRTNVSLGRDFTVAGLKEEGFAAVFLGLGAWDSSKMRVQNEEIAGVLPGIDFLRDVSLGRNTGVKGMVLVVGGGNTAIDCARTALRLGAEEVRILYRRTRTEMPANAMEIDEAEHEGVKIDLLVAPVRVIAADGRATGIECLRMELGEPDASGRRSPKPVRGSEFTVAADFILAAIGQNTKIQELVDGRVPHFLPFGEVLNLTRWQTIQVNDGTCETSVDGVFSGGDVVTGAATAIEAIAAGRRAAYAIDRYVVTGKAQPEPKEFVSRKDAFRKVTWEDLRDGSRSPRRTMPALLLQDRRLSFAEVEQGYTREDVHRESHRCMECGCTALFDCDLRRYATEYGVDITSFTGEAKSYHIDRSHPLIELDPNKCILCGRCVRMCSEVVGAAAFGFINRGFNTVVKPALGGSLLDTECISCGLCIGTCPTGAIAGTIPLTKPGPWQTQSVPTVCHYCGVGCRLDYETYGNTLVSVSRREGARLTWGDHCKKGRFGFDFVHDSTRLRYAKLRAGRELQDTSLEEAIAHTGMRLKELVRRYTGDQIAVFVSPRLTNEEIYLAQKLARIALKTHQVTSFTQLVNDSLRCPEVVSTASYPELEDSQAIVVVNSNLDAEHLVADLLVKRAMRQGGKLVYIGPEANRVASYAEVFLQCKPGEQVNALLALLQEVRQQATGTAAALLAVPPALEPLLRAGSTTLAERAGVRRGAVQEAAQVLCHSIQKVLVFNKDYRGLRRPQDERLFAAVGEALGGSILALREKSNAQGLLDMGASPNWLPGYAGIDDAAAVDEFEKQWSASLAGMPSRAGDVAALLRAKQIKVALVFGEDPLGCADFPAELRDGLLAAEYLVVGDLFATVTAARANAVLPLGSSAETGGTFTNQERRVQRLQRAVPPVAGLETWEILCALAARMGYRFKMHYANIEEVTAEIRRVVPLYRGVAIDSQSSDSIWDASVGGLPRVELDGITLAPPVQPVATLHLDALEARFEGNFEAKMTAAREALEKQAAAVS